jgi:hypothetical protein
LGVPGEFEKLHALIHVRLVGALVPFDLAEAAILLLAPLGRHFLEEGHEPEMFVVVDVQRFGVDDFEQRVIVLRAQPGEG